MPVDIEGRHAVRCERIDRTSARFHLVHSRGDRSSPLHQALLGAVRVRSGQVAEARTCDGGVVSHSGRIELLLRAADGLEHTVARLEFDADGQPSAELAYQLSAFECRYLAEYGRLYPIPRGPTPEPRIRTDLHSHFAGCVRAENLVELAADHNVIYPAALLSQAGIHVDKDISVSALSGPIRSALARQLEVPTERRITFVEMERIYRLRGPLTKAPALFVPLLTRIAQDYAAMGIDYAELSFGPITRADRLRAVHRAVPGIEARTGVRLRFLAAMSRHDDLEWDLDYIDRLKQLAFSRYLVGVDFMGHETNSTEVFARQIREVASWAQDARPGFAIRVHAGENPAHPENVRLALDYVAGRDVSLRIGHGLYGVDDHTLERLADSGSIVEFNLNSNFALNNLQLLREAPIHRYLHAGVDVVLASDGYGIYRSSPALEARAAWLCGLTSADFERIAQTERDYLAMRQRRDAEVIREDFEIPPDRAPVHFVGELPLRRTRERAAVDRRLRTRIDELGIVWLEDTALQQLLASRRCICFAGAWKRSWAALSEQHQAQVHRVLEELFDRLDPNTDLVITGGTQFGVEAVVAKQARRRHVPHLGLLVATTPPEALVPDTITHARIAGRSFHDKAAVLYRLMGRAQGLCVFIGGGNVVSDEIQTARNLRLRYLLMDGPAGASTQHARQEPDRAFTSAAQIAAALAPSTTPTASFAYRHPGPNPTADIVLTRRNPSTRACELLLIRRDLDAHGEAGLWALPGGFVTTHASPGEPWRPDAETEASAALRELYEETGFDLRLLQDQLTRIGSYQGEGRDPRDHDRAWSRSTAFLLALPAALASAPIAGNDDACDAGWYRLDRLPLRLAFDHARIISDALEFELAGPTSAA